MSRSDAVDDSLPSGRWAFDESVTRVFNDMLRRSIPQYELMRATVQQIALEFASATPQPCVVDLGCSRGQAMAPLVEHLDATARFIGVEVAEPMLEAVRHRFAGNPNVEILALDLRSAYPEATASVTLAVLTVQFVPLEHRQRLLTTVFEHTRPDGALVLVEKVLGATESLDQIMVCAHEGSKRSHGYSDEQIVRKRLALHGVLVPVTARRNEELLQTAGFTEVDCFWRWMNFAAWVAVRR